MSNYQRSLALEEIQEPKLELEELLVRHLSISNASAEAQLASQVVKVSGTITVSF